MTWPAWIEELRRRYLADEASAFLVHGAIDDRWDCEGAQLTARECLARMLAGSRQILATYEPSEGLRFHGATDSAAFTRLVETRQALDGRRDRNRGRTPQEALGLIWMALTTPGPAQGYLISGLSTVLPARKKNIEPLAEAAPPLWEWPRDAALRGSNNVVIFLVADPASVRAELPAACALIAVPKAPAAAPPPVAAPPAMAAALAEVEALGSAPEAEAPPLADAVAEVESLGTVTPLFAAPPPPVVAPSTDLADAGAPPSTEALVNAALRAAILRHPVGNWPQNLPAREALAAVMHDLAPQRCGPLTFTVTEGQVACVGPGADWFERWYATDVAVDAAAGMALSGLVVPEGGFTEENLPALTPAAVRALGRRLDKALAAE